MCRAIVCGDGRVDLGEQCDPPAARVCRSDCRAIVCGDGRVDDGEQCDHGGTPNATCSSNCSTIDQTGNVVLYSFDANVQGWALYAASPERLLMGSSARHDSQNGDQTPGTLRLEAPFDASNQKIEVQATFAKLDLRGRTIRARVRLASGLSNDQTNPGGIKLFAKAGDSFNYASGAWTYLRPGGAWTDVTLDCDAPVLVPTAFDASQVRQLGVELRTFTETTGATRAVVYLDSVTY
jgi:hypothetical protein